MQVVRQFFADWAETEVNGPFPFLGTCTILVVLFGVAWWFGWLTTVLWIIGAVVAVVPAALFLIYVMFIIGGWLNYAISGEHHA